MSWEPLTPASRTSGRPMVTARLGVKKDGGVSLTLFLSDFLVREFGEPKAVEAMVGTDDDAGRLRLVFGLVSNPAGSFKVSQQGKAWRVTLPCTAFGQKPGMLAPAGVVIKDVAAGELVLEMPVEAWAGSAIAAARVLTAAAGPGPGAATGGGSARASSGPSPSNPLNAIDYLRQKGRKVEELAGGRLQVDGNVMTRGQVLVAINQLRDAANLPPLSHAEVA